MGVFVAPKANSQQDFIDYIEGGDVTWTTLDPNTALKNSDIFTGVNIISGDIAKGMFRQAKDGNASADFIDMINRRPNQKQTRYIFLFATVANLILSGNSYALIHRDSKNKEVINSLEFVRPDQVNVIQNGETGEWTYDVTMDYGSMMYKCKTEDILHFRVATTDGFLGRSALQSLQYEVQMQTNGTKILNKFFSNGVFGGGILKLKGAAVDQETKMKIRQEFEKANAGTTNSNGVLVLDETQEFQEYKMNTDILKMIQANKFSTQQIAKVLGIPLNRFGMELVNSTDTGQNDIYIASTIAQYETTICDEIAIKTGNQLELDLSSLLNDTIDDRRKRLFEGKGNKEVLKAITTNEVRDYYGYDAVEEGTELMQVENTEKEEYVNENEESGSASTDGTDESRE